MAQVNSVSESPAVNPTFFFGPKGESDIGESFAAISGS